MAAAPWGSRTWNGDTTTERPAKSARKVEDSRMCMSLEAPRQSIRFCSLHSIGFYLDHQWPCSEMQVISFFPLKSRVNPVLLPALLARGRMLLCSNGNWHRRAKNITTCYSPPYHRNETIWYFHLAAPALHFRGCFGVHPATVPQRAFKQH